MVGPKIFRVCIASADRQPWQRTRGKASRGSWRKTGGKPERAASTANYLTRAVLITRCGASGEKKERRISLIKILNSLHGNSVRPINVAV